MENALRIYGGHLDELLDVLREAKAKSIKDTLADVKAKALFDTVTDGKAEAKAALLGVNGTIWRTRQF